MTFNPSQPRDEDGKWASSKGGRRIIRAAKVVGGVAVAGAAAYGLAVGTGALVGLSANAAVRNTVRGMGGNTKVGKIAADAFNKKFGLSNLEAAKMGAQHVHSAIKASATGRTGQLKVALRNQTRNSNRFTGPKIRRMK